MLENFAVYGILLHTCSFSKVLFLVVGITCMSLGSVWLLLACGSGIRNLVGVAMVWSLGVGFEFFHLCNVWCNL